MEPKSELYVRKARQEDVSDITEIIAENVFKTDGSGFLLPLSEKAITGLVEGNKFFSVYVCGRFAGCAAVIGYNGIVELRSLVIREEFRGKGAGSMLIRSCKEDALMDGYSEIYAFTQPQNLELFQKEGFYIEEKPQQKLLKDCLVCPLYDRCKEIPLVHKF